MNKSFYLILAIFGVMVLSYADSGIKDFTEDKYDPDIRMKMTPEIKKLTNNISESFEREVMICMSYSKPNNHTILIDDYKIPYVKYSSNISVISERCNAEYSVTWHNHPPRLVDDVSLSFWWEFNRGIILDNKEKLIYLSNSDIYTALETEEEYTIVSSGANNWAWWSKSQIKSHADSLYMLPIESQHYTEK